MDVSGTGYTLTATATGLPAVASTAFNITPAAASVLAFTVQPTTTPAAATITPPVQVSAQDAFGNLVPTFVGTVTVAIAAGTGTSGATLAGTTTAAAVGGVATFATLSISTSGTGYALTARSEERRVGKGGGSRMCDEAERGSGD